MVTTSTTAPADDELRDADVVQAARIGTPIGILTLYAIVTVVAVLGGNTWSEALSWSLWPALVAGPFFGSLIALGLLVARQEHRAEVMALPTTEPRPTATPRAA